ncbi:MAG: sporulation protein YabP [Peptococcaceae bacterium]|nr:sporulation protein YabP [Peptococcaceae bacterium]
MQEQEILRSAVLELKDRQMMRLSGVQNVDVFDEEKIVLQTELGKLEIRGQHLNVTSLDVENGNLQVDGMIDSFVYLEEKRKRSMKKKTSGNRFRLFS